MIQVAFDLKIWRAVYTFFVLLNSKNLFCINVSVKYVICLAMRASASPCAGISFPQ